MNLADLIARHIADPQTTWAIGTFGAIAEFHRDPEEAVGLCIDGTVTAVTPRGGIRLRCGEAVRAIAWESPAAGDTWTHGMAFCLPADAGAMNARTVITELGADIDALNADGQGAILFDLGLDAPHCDVCIRTANPTLVSLLRAAAGRPLLEADLFAPLRDMSPTRVFQSRLGRIEVHTPIPGPRGETSDGPHTHLLPDLLKHRRTHSANVPLPDGLVPCAEMFPANAIRDAHGRRQPFDPLKHEFFQRLFAVHGDPACVQAKRDTIAAVRSGKPPVDEPAYHRAQRLARRVALRQLAQTDGPSAALALWQKAFDAA